MSIFRTLQDQRRMNSTSSSRPRLLKFIDGPHESGIYASSFTLILKALPASMVVSSSLTPLAKTSRNDKRSCSSFRASCRPKAVNMSWRQARHSCFVERDFSLPLCLIRPAVQAESLIRKSCVHHQMKTDCQRLCSHLLFAGLRLEM